MGPRLAAMLALLGSAASIGLLVATTLPGLLFLIVPVVLLTFGVAWCSRAAAPHLPALLPVLLVGGAGLAVGSIVTGALNGFSDEPYTTPAYAALGWHLYTQPIHLVYLQYGVSHTETSYDVYLPLLTFLQVPGLDYRWVSLGAWAVVGYLLRRNPFAVGGWATGWVPLLAANGQNDFVPLLALTVALVVPLGRGNWAAEAVALALKQPANLVVFFYHVARREYMRAGVAVAVTFAVLAPFLWIDAGSVVCHVIVGDPGNGCTGHPWTFFVFKRNYWLYPAWVGLAFHSPLGAWAERAGRRLRPGGRT